MKSKKTEYVCKTTLRSANTQAEYERWIQEGEIMANKVPRRADAEFEMPEEAEAEADLNARERIHDWLQNLKVTIGPIPNDVWDVAAEEHRRRYSGQFDGMRSKDLFSYIRHELTNYDGLREELGKFTHDGNGRSVVSKVTDIDKYGRSILASCDDKFVHLLRRKVNAAITDALKRRGIPLDRIAGHAA